MADVAPSRLITASPSSCVRWVRLSATASSSGTPGKRARVVPLIAEVHEMVRRHIDAVGGRGRARLFTGPRGGRVRTAVLRDATHWGRRSATWPRSCPTTSAGSTGVPLSGATVTVDDPLLTLGQGHPPPTARTPTSGRPRPTLADRPAASRQNDQFAGPADCFGRWSGRFADLRQMSIMIAAMARANTRPAGLVRSPAAGSLR
jgi:hypothetical protein